MSGNGWFANFNKNQNWGEIRCTWMMLPAQKKFPSFTPRQCWQLRVFVGIFKGGYKRVKLGSHWPRGAVYYSVLRHLKQTQTWSSCCRYIKGKRSFVHTWLEWKLTDIKSVILPFHIFHVRAQKGELVCALTNNNFFINLNVQFCTVLCCLFKHGTAQRDFVQPVGTQLKSQRISSARSQ